MWYLFCVELFDDLYLAKFTVHGNNNTGKRILYYYSFIYYSRHSYIVVFLWIVRTCTKKNGHQMARFANIYILFLCTTLWKNNTLTYTGYLFSWHLIICADNITIMNMYAMQYIVSHVNDRFITCLSKAIPCISRFKTCLSRFISCHSSLRIYRKCVVSQGLFSAKLSEWLTDLQLDKACKEYMRRMFMLYFDSLNTSIYIHD